MSVSQFLTPEVAARAKQLELFARTRVEGMLKGQNWSRLKGTSIEFLQHRLYAPGDDLRSIDWRVSARRDRMVTREFEEFTNFDAILALDCSGSMDYQGEGMSKIEFARHCAAMLAWLVNAQNDRYGLALFSDKVTGVLAPSNGRKHMAELFRRIVAHPVAGETDFTVCTRQMLKRVRRRSVFLFFSDCFQDPEALTKSVGLLRLQGHDVLFFHIYDPSETDLAFSGFTQFVDLETKQIDAADPMEIRRAYQDVWTEHADKLERGFARFGIDFCPLPVQPNWDATLARLLRERASK